MPTDPLWINGVTSDGIELRRADALLVMHNGTALGGTAGVTPGGGGLNVSIAGSTITVGSGRAWVYQSGQGVYRAVMPSATTLTLTAAHATLSRIDLVYLRVWDTSVDASGLNQADTVYLAGTASSTPVAPTPAGTQIYIPLANITVPPSGGGSPTVSQSVMPTTVAPGGILPSTVAPPSPYTGQFYDNGTDLLRYNGSSWDTYYKVPGAWTPYTPTWTATTTNPTLGNGTLVGRYSKIGRQVTVHINLIPGSTTTFGSGSYNFAVPFAAANLGCSYIMSAHLLGTDRWLGETVISPAATTTAAFFPTAAGNSRANFWSPSAPEAFANGSQIRITGSYESAS